MTEVGIQPATKRESGIAAVQCVVTAGLVMNGLVGQARDELVAEADALCWTKGVAIKVAIVLVQSLVVVVLVEVFLGAERAELGEGAVR